MAIVVPQELLDAEGRSNDSLTEERLRRDTRICLGGKKIQCPRVVREDKLALREWRKLAALYAEFDYVEKADVNLLRDYCKGESELLRMYRNLKIFLREHRGGKFFDSLPFIVTVEKEIRAKRTEQHRMADALMLTPQSRIKAAYQLAKKKEKESPLNKSGFDNV